MDNFECFFDTHYVPEEKKKREHNSVENVQFC